MCSSLKDWFSCLRSQENDIELDVTQEAPQKAATAGEDGARKPPQGQRLKADGALASAVTGSAATMKVLKSGRPPNCIRPNLRDSRVSYEAMERYDQMVGGANSGDRDGTVVKCRIGADQ